MKLLTTLFTSTLIATATLPGLAAAQKAQPVIGVSMASDVNPFYIAMKKGIEQRAAEVGAKVVVVTANEVVAQQVSGLQDLAAQKVDGILVSPIDAVAVRSGYETAAKAGIPVISVARHADSPHQSAFVTMDEKKVGADIGAWVAKSIGGSGEIAMITGPAGAATFRNTAAGFDTVLEKHPDIKVMMRKDAPLTREAGLKLAEDALIAYPNLKAIYTANDELALGAVQAVASLGKKDAVVVTGMNGIPPALRAIKSGDLGLTVELNPVAWGRLAVDTMMDYLNGKKPEGNVAITHVLIDKTNVDEVLNRNNKK